MPTRSAVDWEAVESTAQNLVLTRRELHQLGVTPRMIWARVRYGGPWQRLLPGTIMLRNGTPTHAQRLDAALRYAGHGAVLTGLTAARLHGLAQVPPEDQVHLLLPDTRQPNTCEFVLVERTTRPPTTLYRQGFPVAEVTRCVLDGTRRMSDRRQVEAVLAESVQRGFTTPAKLSIELEAGSDRGSARPRAALRAISLGARSTAEIDGTRLAIRARLPEPKWNVALRTSNGLALPTPDAWFDDVALAWEIDSYAWHLSPASYAKTLSRHNAMTGAGIIVLHTLPTQLREEPGRVIADLQAAYVQAASRPRPALIAG